MSSRSVSGGATSQVLDWGLQITAVPEPVTVSLGIFGGLFALVGLCRSRQGRKFWGWLRAG